MADFSVRSGKAFSAASFTSQRSQGVDGIWPEGPMDMEGTVRDATVHSMRSVRSITSCKSFDSVPAAPVTILEGYNNHEVACTDRTLGDLLSTYLRKMAGGVDTPLKPAPVMELVASFIGAFLSILLVSACQRWLSPRVSLPLMIASFGATAVLLFGAPESKMAQPRNCLGGHLIGALIGCAIRVMFPSDLAWLSAALGMSLSLLAMMAVGLTHPPGGATALIAAAADEIGPWYGFKFVLTAEFGALGMTVVALLVNNLSPRRVYPTFW